MLGPSVGEHRNLDDADDDDKVGKPKVLVLVEVSAQDGLSFFFRNCEFGNVSVTETTAKSANASDRQNFIRLPHNKVDFWMMIGDITRMYLNGWKRFELFESRPFEV